jgi:hypothetical protein
VAVAGRYRLPPAQESAGRLADLPVLADLAWPGDNCRNRVAQGVAPGGGAGKSGRWNVISAHCHPKDIDFAPVALIFRSGERTPRGGRQAYSVRQIVAIARRLN